MQAVKSEKPISNIRKSTLVPVTVKLPHHGIRLPKQKMLTTDRHACLLRMAVPATPTIQKDVCDPDASPVMSSREETCDRSSQENKTPQPRHKSSRYVAQDKHTVNSLRNAQV